MLQTLIDPVWNKIRKEKQCPNFHGTQISLRNNTNTTKNVQTCQILKIIDIVSEENDIGQERKKENEFS